LHQGARASSATLTEPNCLFARSIASVYPFGANVMSWKLKNGSEVLYARPDDSPTEPDGVRPLKCARCERMQAVHCGVLTTARVACRGGVPIYFPQVGSGDGAPGSIPGQEPMQMHGFARNMEWDIVKTVRRQLQNIAFERSLRNWGTQGLTDFEKWPYVCLRLRDTPYSRSMWDHAFELEYEVTLGERHIIMRLAVRNTGKSDFSFTTALNSCIAVHDIRFPQRSFYKVCVLVTR